MASNGLIERVANEKYTNVFVRGWANQCILGKEVPTLLQMITVIPIIISNVQPNRSVCYWTIGHR